MTSYIRVIKKEHNFNVKLTNKIILGVSPDTYFPIMLYNHPETSHQNMMTDQILSQSIFLHDFIFNFDSHEFENFHHHS